MFDQTFLFFFAKIKTAVMYNNKGLINQISFFFSFKSKGLKDYVKGLITHNDKAIIEALRFSLPELQISNNNI